MRSSSAWLAVLVAAACGGVQQQADATDVDGAAGADANPLAADARGLVHPAQLPVASDSQDVNWTESSCVSIVCGSTLPLYCVEQ